MGGGVLRSMTGCGRSQKQSDGITIAVELKSVNHRYLDVSCRLPHATAFLEDTVKRGIAAHMKRGHIDAYVTLTRSGASSSVISIDEQLAAEWKKAADQLSGILGNESKLSVFELLQLEGVAKIVEADLDEEAAKALCMQAVDEAAAQLVEMRSVEGDALRQDLLLHLNEIASIRKQIVDVAGTVVLDYRDKLVQRLSQLSVDEVDPARLAQEVAVFADRCAIDEELSRLESHINQMHTFIDSTDECGKKMDFLIQEMNRETNTIGSKANNA